jgi:hypothetical protein
MAQPPAPMQAPEGQHDPGSEVQLPLHPDILHKSAEFSVDGRHRSKLERDWTPDGEEPSTILFIGMNPSTAEANLDDRTCQKEQKFSRRDGYTRYLKGNILDYRLTDSKQLSTIEEPVSDRNLSAILEMAEEAEVIVLCCGQMKSKFHPIIQRTIDAILETGKPIKYFGSNEDGSFKHPLYLPDDKELMDCPRDLLEQYREPPADQAQ